MDKQIDFQAVDDYDGMFSIHKHEDNIIRVYSGSHDEVGVTVITDDDLLDLYLELKSYFED